MITPTGIPEFAYLLLHLAGADVRADQPGVRITISPLPHHTKDAHTQAYSVDMENTGFDRAIQALRAGITPAVTPQPYTGTEAA